MFSTTHSSQFTRMFRQVEEEEVVVVVWVCSSGHWWLEYVLEGERKQVPGRQLRLPSAVW